eukprot:15432949-Alexandrium_andersonii.AAC.1
MRIGRICGLGALQVEPALRVERCVHACFHCRVQHERVNLGCALVRGLDACGPDLLRMRVHGAVWA